MIPVETGFEDARDEDLGAALHSGRCIGVDPELFFPEEPGHDQSEAMDVCAACPVRLQCLELTLRGPVVRGVRAGTSWVTRQRMRAYRDSVSMASLAGAL